MQLKLPYVFIAIGVALLCGILIGGYLGPTSVLASNTAVEQTEQKKYKPVSTTGMQSRLLDVRQLSSQLYLPKWENRGKTNNEDWLVVFKEFSENIDRSGGDKQIQARMLANLVDSDQFPGLIEAMNSEENKLSNIDELKIAFLTRWLHVDASGLEQWFGALSGEAKLINIEYLLTDVSNADGEAVLQLYDKHLGGSHEMVTADKSLMQLVSDQMIKHRSAVEYWKYYDSLPGASTYNYISPFEDIEEDRIGEYLNAYYDRSENLTKYNFMNNLYIDYSIRHWASIDPESALQWAREKEGKHISKVISEIYNFGKQDMFPRLEVELENNEKLANQVYRNILNQSTSKDYDPSDYMKNLFDSLDRLPDFVRVETPELDEKVKNIISQHPLSIPELVSVVPIYENKSEAIIDQILAHSRMNVEEFNETDIAVFENNLTKTSLSKFDKESVMEALRYVIKQAVN